MKIAFLIQDCTTMGGTERVTCCLASEMARRGHEVSLISVFSSGGSCKFPLDESVRFVTLCDMDYDLRKSKMKRVKMLVRLARDLRRNAILLDADVVIAQKFFAAFMAVRAGFRRKLIIGDHYPYRLYGEPWLRIRDLIYRHARTVVVLTENCRRDFRLNGVSKVEVVGNMMTLPDVHHTGESQNLILAVGRLSHEKGFDTLIEAVSRVVSRIDRWRVEICGEGEERDSLEALISQYHLEDKVLLRGRVDDVSAEYARASFVVVPSRYEGFSLVLLEAASMHLPVVAFDCPYGPAEILCEGGGILVHNQNIDALGEAIVRMAGDERLRCRCADQTAKIVERYSPEKIYNQWMRIIKKYL